MPSSNIGMPAGQRPPLQFSQPTQQLSHWPTPSSHATASSQALPLPYVHPNRPLTTGPSQLQQTTLHFAPSFFGHLQNNAAASSQFQPMPQLSAPALSTGGQPSLSTGSNGQQPSVPSSSDPAVNARS